MEGAGGPPRDQERITSSPLALSLAMSLLKAWCPFPASALSVPLILGRPQA